MSADALRAIRYLKNNHGPIHRNSAAYKRVIEEVRASDTPMTTAKTRLKTMLAVREAETRQSLTALVHDLIRQHQGVNTVVLDLVLAELRRGYPGQRLDPQHYAMIETFEAAIFAETAKPDDLLALIGRLTKIGVYDSRRACWHTYRQP